MIVVAIIGILAAVAIPAYQNYTIKSQATSALAEITPAKAMYEVVVNEGKTPSLTAADTGFVGVTEDGGTYCTIAVLADNGGLECTIKGSSAVINTKKITWTRSSAGVWSCTTDIVDANHRPGSCAAAT